MTQKQDGKQLSDEELRQEVEKHAARRLAAIKKAHEEQKPTDA